MGQLYLGRNLVTPILSVNDFTTMGNELRKACAWTCVQNGKGKIRLGYINSITTPSINWCTNMIDYNGNSLVSPDFSNDYFIVDGKLYQINMTGSIVDYTLIDSDTDWNMGLTGLAIGNRFIKNGSYYTSFSDAKASTNAKITNLNINDIKYRNSYAFQYGLWSNAGILYNDYTQLDISIFGTGWDKFNGETYSLLGLKNNKLTYAATTTSATEIYNTELTPDQIYFMPTGYIKAYICQGIIRKQISNINSGNPQIEEYTNFEFSVKKLIYQTVLYLGINNNLYYQANNQSKSTLLIENVKDIIYLMTTSYSSPTILILTENNDLYYIYTSSVSQIKFIENIGDNAHLVKCHDYANSSNMITVRYTDDSDVSTTIYTVNNNTTTNAYLNMNIVTPQTITARSGNTITVNGNVYVRDTSKDSVFNFVPEELRNYQYNDQELCQAYLNAGLNQGE